MQNVEAQTKLSFSKNTDKEKRWLVATANEETSEGTGFMLKLNLRLGEQYPEENPISKQHLMQQNSKKN